MSHKIELILSTSENAGQLLAGYLMREMGDGKKVLWFVSGGSSIPITQAAIRIIREIKIEKLRILLVDEKFKDVSQSVTNWSQLTDGKVVLSEIIPSILRDGCSIEDSLRSFQSDIKESLEWADYTIGQFGIGEGFHTGGIQNHSEAINDNALAVHYRRGEFHHISVTTKLISLLDLVFVNSFGDSKKKLVEHFSNSTASIQDEPTQVLKSAARVILATDIDVAF